MNTQDHAEAAPGAPDRLALSHRGGRSNRAIPGRGVKFAYIKLNMPMPCPPRSTVPVNRPRGGLRRCWAAFGHEFGETCDVSDVVDREPTRSRLARPAVLWIALGSLLLHGVTAFASLTPVPRSELPGIARHLRSITNSITNAKVVTVSCNPSNTVSCVWDANGNLLSRRDAQAQSTTTYRYDALSRLRGVVKETPVSNFQFPVSFSYDPFNRRVAKTISVASVTSVVHYLWTDQSEIGCADESGNLLQLRALGSGLGNDIGAAIGIELRTNAASAWTVYVPVHDHRGNVVLLLNQSTGAAVEYYRYDAFGNVERFGTDTGNPWLFSSKRVDSEFGFIYFNRRYYDPDTGRFTTTDPLGYLDGFNRYAYVGNNPLVFVDPQGLLGKHVYQEGLSPTQPLIKLLDELENTTYSPGMAFTASLSSDILQMLADMGAPETYVLGYRQAVDQTSLVMYHSLQSGDNALYASGQGLGYAAGNIIGYTPFVEGILGLDVATGQDIAGVERFSRTSRGAGQMILVGTSVAASYNPSAQTFRLYDPRSTAYRYVSEGEAAVARQSGRAPNVTRAGDPKHVHYSGERFGSASAAEDALRIGSRNPRGATASPTHRITVDSAGADWVTGGNVAGGTGTELITIRELPVIRIDPLGR